MTTSTDQNSQDILSNIDILIPLYLDHSDRIFNTKTVVKHLKSQGFKNIFIKEYHTTESPNEEISNLDGVNFYHKYITNFDNFNKMECVNELSNISSGEYVAIYDADVIIPRRAMVKTAELLNSGVNVVYPYGGEFYNVPKDKFKDLESGKISLDDCELCNPCSYGGAVFFNRTIFEDGGMCNPNFKNVGFDDNEIFVRFSRLGYTIGRVEGPLLHLDHVRSNTSVENSAYLNHNMQIYNHILNCDINDLKNEIKIWNK